MTLSSRFGGLEQVQAFLRELPRNTRRVAIKAFGEYVLGNDDHGLRHMVGYKFVSRQAAYGFSFFTDKQRRWFFWALGQGKIDPGSGTRHDTTRGWTGKETNNGLGYTMSAKGNAVKYTMSDTQQSRQAAKVGHRKVSDVVRSNMPGGLRAAVAAANNWIREHIK